MTGIIINTLAGLMPTSAEELKLNIDHCETIIVDCNETIQNNEVQQHDRDVHIKLRSQARTALNMLKQITV